MSKENKPLVKHENGNDFIADVSERFKSGDVWESTLSEKVVRKTIEKEWSKTEVRLTSSQVFTKIFLSKNYRYIGSVNNN